MYLPQWCCIVLYRAPVSQQCVYATQTANIPAADLLYVNYNNLVEGLLPYSVVLDVAKRCVVVAIRGSLSVEDCVTGAATATCIPCSAAIEGHCRAQIRWLILCCSALLMVLVIGPAFNVNS